MHIQDGDKDTQTLGDADDKGTAADQVDEIEVELEEDDPAGGADKGEEDGRGGRKPGSQRAIDRKTKQATEAEQTSDRAIRAFENERNRNDEMQRNNAELAKRMARSEEQRRAASDAAVGETKRAATAEIKLAKRDLEAAISAADAAAQADATARLNKAQTDLSGAENWEATQKVTRDREAREAEEKQKNPDRPKLREDQFTVAQWQGQNEWANPMSANYDRDAFTAVKDFAKDLDASMIEQGMGGQRLTVEYWQRINAEYERVKGKKVGRTDDGDGRGARRNGIPEMGAGDGLAAVGAEGAQPGGRDGGEKQKVRLSSDDLRRVDQWVGTMTDANGRALTRGQIIQVFVKDKLKQSNKNQRRA